MLGGAIVRRLLERGDRVRALVRDDTSERALTEAGASALDGDESLGKRQREALEALRAGPGRVSDLATGHAGATHRRAD